MITTMKFQKLRVVFFSIEENSTFSIWRKGEVVEKIERTALYKLVWTVFRAIHVYEKDHFFMFLSNFLLVNYYISLLFQQIMFE